MREQYRFASGWIFGLALALLVVLGAPGFTPDARAAEFNMALRAPESVLQNQNVEMIAVVTDKNGQPVDGMPVQFQVPPAWENDVTLSNQSIATKNGEARIFFRSGMTGVVVMTARAGDATATTHITVSGTGSNTKDETVNTEGNVMPRQ